jgi:hypothetical protein
MMCPILLEFCHNPQVLHALHVERAAYLDQCGAVLMQRHRAAELGHKVGVIGDHGAGAVDGVVPARQVGGCGGCAVGARGQRSGSVDLVPVEGHDARWGIAWGEWTGVYSAYGDSGNGVDWEPWSSALDT